MAAAMARQGVADPATAEDILQDVFLKFQSRLDELRDPTQVPGWLFLVARNAIIDYYRTRKPTSPGFVNRKRPPENGNAPAARARGVG